MVEKDKTEIFIDPSKNEKIGAKNIIRVSETWRKIDFLNLLLSTASAQNTSVITVSHDMRIASKFDRVFLMPRREPQHVLA